MANYSMAHLIDAIKTKGLRFVLVSVGNVIIGQGVLFLFATVLGWNPVLSNFLAVCISAGPAYIFTRAWVWGKSGKSHLTKEVLPFWGMALAGLGFSSIAVAATANLDIPLIANIANLTAFGILWVIKFLILDALMFGTHHHVPEDVADETPA